MRFDTWWSSNQGWLENELRESWLTTPEGKRLDTMPAGYLEMLRTNLDALFRPPDESAGRDRTARDPLPTSLLHLQVWQVLRSSQGPSVFTTEGCWRIRLQLGPWLERRVYTSYFPDLRPEEARELVMASLDEHGRICQVLPKYRLVGAGLRWIVWKESHIVAGKRRTGPRVVPFDPTRADSEPAADPPEPPELIDSGLMRQAIRAAAVRELCGAPLPAAADDISAILPIETFCAGQLGVGAMNKQQIRTLLRLSGTTVNRLVECGSRRIREEYEALRAARRRDHDRTR